MDFGEGSQTSSQAGDLQPSALAANQPKWKLLDLHCSCILIRQVAGEDWTRFAAISEFRKELDRRLKTPHGEYKENIPAAEKVVDEARRKPLRIGSLDGIIPPPPEDFFAPLSEEELRAWEGGDP